MRDVAPLQGDHGTRSAKPPMSNLTRRRLASCASRICRHRDRGDPWSESADAEKLDWSDLDLNPHRTGVEQWGYRSADVFRTRGEEPLGITVIDQHLEEPSREIWHLHPDLIVALGLLQEGDSWHRPEEGWVEVVRMKRNADGKPVLLEIKAEFLADYLAARGMALYSSSCRERISVAAAKPPYSWPDDMFQEEENRDRREALTVDATYPDPEGSFWTRGALWRPSRWRRVRPACASAVTRTPTPPPSR